MKTLFNTLILLLLAVKTEIDKNETNAKLWKLASSQEKLASSQKFHTKQILSKLDGNDENHEFHHDENSELHKIKKSKAKTNKFELNNSNVKLLLLFASVIGILALFRNGAKINNINKNVGNLSKNVGNLKKIHIPQKYKLTFTTLTYFYDMHSTTLYFMFTTLC